MLMKVCAKQYMDSINVDKRLVRSSETVIGDFAGNKLVYYFKHLQYIMRNIAHL